MVVEGQKRLHALQARFYRSTCHGGFLPCGLELQCGSPELADGKVDFIHRRGKGSQSGMMD